ncbi:MAG TPA: PQQ-binding-like beta-propeller repeat protein [Bryobacteraceae bacterium]|nr:PQQ-binding-like beta-propeller repeat protein [Bryobacteraceae bacterium]
MRKSRYLIVSALACLFAYGADWLTDGGNPQRTAWQKDEHILTKENVKGMQILWKINLGNQPREMHSLFAPLIVDNVKTPEGAKQIVIEAGISDNIYAIDAATGKLIWQKHFEYPPIAEGRGLRAGDPLCPGGQTATPVIGPPTASGARIAYAMAGDGKVHTLNVANGEEMSAPFKLGFGNGKNYALNLWDGVLFTTTSQGCNGNPNQMWAVKLDDPEHKVMTASPKSGGLWGRTGAAIDSNGVAWAPTGDGRYDKETETYGNGLIGAKVVGDQLKIEDYFIPSNWSWLQKRDLDFQVTPAIFNYKGKELLATGSKECRVYLLDVKDAGGEDHQTPLDRTPIMCNEEVNFASAGIWGSMASWEDSKGTRWVLTPFWGPVHPRFKVPVSYGPVKDGAVVAFKVEESAGKFRLVPAWMSRNMNRAEPPVIANGVVYAYGNGENTEQAYPETGLNDASPLRIKNSTHAVLYALDAETGKELYSSGDQISSFAHFAGLSIANGHVYLGTFDSVLYCFGLPGH